MHCMLTMCCCPVLLLACLVPPVVPGWGCMVHHSEGSSAPAESPACWDGVRSRTA
jgi:hypothetical protein